MRYRYCEGFLQERRLAQVAVTEACRVLKIPTPEIKFFRQSTEFEDNFNTFESSDDHMFGFTDGRTISLRRNLPDMDLMTTAVHEARHCWQYRRSEWGNRSAAMRERDARLFELAWPRSESAAEKLVFKKLFAT